MRQRATGRAVSVGFLLRCRAQTAVLALMGTTIGATVVGSAAVRDSSERAILDSLRADLGRKAFVLQTTDPRAVDALRGLSNAGPVQDELGDVSAKDGELSAPALIRRTTSPDLRLGVVVAGTSPREIGDLVLSEATATGLGVALGERVTVNTSGAVAAGRVVGLSVDPANADNSTVVQLVAPDSGFAPSRWLSDGDFYDEAALQPHLDRRTAVYQSTGALLENALVERPRFLSAMRFLPTGAGLLLSVVALSVLAVMARRWRGYVLAMVAGGMPPKQAWQRMLGTVFGVVVAGELLGAAFALAALAATRGWVSGWFGQRWISVAVPVSETVCLVLGGAVAAAAALLVAKSGTAWAARAGSAGRQRGWATPAAGGVLLVTAAGWLALTRGGGLQEKEPGSNTLALLLAAGGVACLPFVLVPLSAVGLPSASRRLLKQLAAGLRPVVAAACAVAVLGGAWAAQTTRDANVGEALTSPLEPAGSFVISEMPNDVIPALERIYNDRGGNRLLRYGIPDETAANLRATTTDLLACMSEQDTTDPSVLPPRCFAQDASAPINSVMIGEPGSAAVADPRLLQDGKIGLLLFESGAPGAARLADTSAEPDDRLGGNLPGLVVPPESKVLEAFGIRPSAKSTVMLLDFASLAPSDRLYVRAATLRLAPSAQTADGSDPTAYDRLRTTADAVGVLGALAAVTLLLLGGVAVAVAHVVSRRTMVDLGSLVFRWQLAARLTAVPVVTAALSVPVALITASAGAAGPTSQYGSLWMLPGAVAVLASAAVGALFLAAPLPDDA